MARASAHGVLRMICLELQGCSFESSFKKDGQTCFGPVSKELLLGFNVPGIRLFALDQIRRDRAICGF